MLQRGQIPFTVSASLEATLKRPYSGSWLVAEGYEDGKQGQVQDVDGEQVDRKK